MRTRGFARNKEHPTLPTAEKWDIEMPATEDRRRSEKRQSPTRSLRFDTRWFLRNTKIPPKANHEAGNSTRVHNVLQGFLSWPGEDILAQNHRNGIVDYLIDDGRTRIWVEVKRYDQDLRNRRNAIRKYIFPEEAESGKFNVGVLTNFREWHVYLSGADLWPLAGDDLVRVKEVSVSSEQAASNLRSILGRQSKRRVVDRLLPLLGASEEVLSHMLTSNPLVLEQIADKLAHLDDPPDEVPSSEMLGYLVHRYLRNEYPHDPPITRSDLREALEAHRVFYAVEDAVEDRVGTCCKMKPYTETVRAMGYR